MFLSCCSFKSYFKKKNMPSNVVGTQNLDCIKKKSPCIPSQLKLKKIALCKACSHTISVSLIMVNYICCNTVLWFSASQSRIKALLTLKSFCPVYLFLKTFVYHIIWCLVNISLSRVGFSSPVTEERLKQLHWFTNVVCWSHSFKC